MIGFIFLGFLVTLFIIEIISMKIVSTSVFVSYKVDMKLVEPDEKITLYYEIVNRSKFPLLYISFALYFDNDINIEENEEWKNKYLEKSYFSRRISHNIILMPHKKYKGRIHFSYKTRGIHKVGKFYVETGDFLGIKTEVKSYEIKDEVVCTSRISDQNFKIDPMGGLLGNISVRRFIFEDPTLVRNYNDYTGMEPMKMISWNQSAKVNKLMVKQNDYTIDVNVSVLINMERPLYNDKEKTLEIIRKVCEYLEENKIPYSFYTNGDLSKLSEALGKNHLRRILYNIGVSSYTNYYSFYDVINKGLTRRKENNGFIVIMPLENKKDYEYLNFLEKHCDSKICLISESGGDRL